ncbi:small integral membrane protein 26 [Pelodytes ibericus]
MASLKQYLTWNKRLSMAYAFGIWTAVGSYGFYYFTNKRHEDAKIPKPDEALVDDAFDKKEEKKKTGFYMENTVVYKENFVPYSTRLSNLVSRLFGTSSGTTVERDRAEK